MNPSDESVRWTSAVESRAVKTKSSPSRDCRFRLNRKRQKKKMKKCSCSTTTNATLALYIVYVMYYAFEKIWKNTIVYSTIYNRTCWQNRIIGIGAAVAASQGGHAAASERLSLPQRKDKNRCIRRKRVISTSAYKTCLRNRVILIGAAGAASLGGRAAASEFRSLFYKERTKMHLRRKKSDSLFN